MSEIEVVTGEDRFAVEVDGHHAGATYFHDWVHDGIGRRIFFHTEVDDAYAGQGLAGRLVGEALDHTREAGLRVVAVCPYVAAYVERHPEYADLADPVTPAALAVLEERGTA